MKTLLANCWNNNAIMIGRRIWEVATCRYRNIPYVSLCVKQVIQFFTCVSVLITFVNDLEPRSEPRELWVCSGCKMFQTGGISERLCLEKCSRSTVLVLRYSRK